MESTRGRQRTRATSIYPVDAALDLGQIGHATLYGYVPRRTGIGGCRVSTAMWALVASVVGGVVGAGVKFTFEDLLRPKIGWRRDTQRIVRRFTTPLLRSTEALERRINNLVRNQD